MTKTVYLNWKSRVFVNGITILLGHFLKSTRSTLRGISVLFQTTMGQVLFTLCGVQLRLQQPIFRTNILLTKLKPLMKAQDIQVVTHWVLQAHLLQAEIIHKQKVYRNNFFRYTYFLFNVTTTTSGGLLIRILPSPLLATRYEFPTWQTPSLYLGKKRLSGENTPFTIGRRMSPP